jgi:hypothetical protein
MEISRQLCSYKQKESIAKDPKPFAPDENPFAAECLQLPSPFQLLSLTGNEPSGASKEIDLFFSEVKHQVLHAFECRKKGGFEATRFQLVSPLKTLEETIEFEVRYYDTAQMEIQLEIQGSDKALELLIPSLQDLYNQIASSVFPYELRLIIPPSIQNNPRHASTIKNLCKEQRTVYRVNEYEQAF